MADVSLTGIVIDKITVKDPKTDMTNCLFSLESNINSFVLDNLTVTDMRFTDSSTLFKI